MPCLSKALHRILRPISLTIRTLIERRHELRNTGDSMFSRINKMLSISRETANKHVNADSETIPKLTEDLVKCHLEDPDLLSVDKPFMLDILDLPCELRDKIWQNFNRSEIKVLRQVCSTIRSDIDYILGVDGILDGTLSNLYWIQKVSVHSLTVQCLQLPMPSPFLRLPFLLKKLVIIQGSVPTSNIQALLNTFTNLSDLTLVSTTASFWRQVPIHFLTSDHIYDVIQCVLANPKLKFLNFTLSSTGTGEPKNEEQETLLEPTPTFCRADLQHIRVAFPDLWETTDPLLTWRAFLKGQNKLKTFSSNLGTISWKFYSAIMLQCRLTLTRVALYDIQCSTRQGDPEVFDWELFADFMNLTSFKLLAKQRGQAHVEYLQHMNFHLFPMRKLTELLLNYVALCEPAVSQIFENGVQLQILNLQFFCHPVTSLFYYVKRVIPSRRFEKITIVDRKPLFEIQDIPRHLIHDTCERSFYSTCWTSNQDSLYEFMQLCRNVKRTTSGSVQSRISKSFSEINY